MAYAHQFGVTSVQNAGGSLEDVALYDRRARRRIAGADLPRLSASSGTTRLTSTAWCGAGRLGDDPTLTTGAVKIYADGVIESRTAAMLAPYANSPSAGAPNLVRRASWSRSWRWWTSADGRSGSTRSATGDPHGARRLRARGRGQPGAGARPAASHRAHRDHRCGRHPAIRRSSGVIASQQPMHVPLGDMNSDAASGPWPDNIGPSARRAPGRGKASGTRAAG